jgi:DNA mismatch repair protein MutS
MQAIQQTLKQACEIQKKLCAVNVLLATDLGHRINSCLQLVDVLERAIVDSPPARASDGGLVRPGYSVTLDELRGEAVSLESRCAALVEKYRKETSTKS